MQKTSLPISVIVKKIIKENFRTKSFVLDGKIKALPGQFVMIWLPGIAEKPFSITDNNPFTITVMEVGKFTKHLNQNIKTGDKIWYRGPFGKGVFKEEKGRKILVSGGCGCVPLFFFAKTLKNKKQTQVIIGAKTKKELLFQRRFKNLGIKTTITTDDGSQGIKGFTTDILSKLISNSLISPASPRLRRATNQLISCVYACGPEIMLKKIAKICEEKKVKYQLSLEALIKCGFGICGSCSKCGKLICKDGPVFTKWIGK